MRCSTMMQYYYMKIFFYGKKVFTAGSCLQPAVLMSPSPTVPDTNRRCWCSHHQRFWNQRWWPRYHQRLKSNGTQNRWWWGLRTGGDKGGCSSVHSKSFFFSSQSYFVTVSFCLFSLFLSLFSILVVHHFFRLAAANNSPGDTHTMNICMTSTFVRLNRLVWLV